MELEKASAFVDRLLSNPALNGLNPLQKEEQITQFLQVNAMQLSPTLSSAQFFPSKHWDEIYLMLISALMKKTDNILFPLLKNQILDKIDLSFVSLLKKQNISGDRLKTELEKFLGEILKNQTVRREFSGVLNSLLFRISDKYVDQCFKRNEYVHFELVKVQRLRMGSEEIKNLLRVSLLFKPAVYYFIASSSGGGHDPAHHFQQPQFMERVYNTLEKRIGIFPEQVLHSGLNSNLSFIDNMNLETTSRIGSILDGLCRNYRPGIVADRGADTAEKSWLSVARRNFRFYGFDVKILDEFYKIAAENGW